MRSTVITVGLLAFTNAAQGAIYLFHNDAYGKRVRITISDEMLKKTSKWDKKSDNPPLSARKAMGLAEKAKLQLDRKYMPKYKFKFESATICPGKDDRWYWVLYYEEFNPNLVSGSVSSLRLVVLMDGTVLHGYPMRVEARNFKTKRPRTGRAAVRATSPSVISLDQSKSFR